MYITLFEDMLSFYFMYIYNKRDHERNGHIEFFFTWATHVLAVRKTRTFWPWAASLIAALQLLLDIFARRTQKKNLHHKMQ